MLAYIETNKTLVEAKLAHYTEVHRNLQRPPNLAGNEAELLDFEVLSILGDEVVAEITYKFGDVSRVGRVVEGTIPFRLRWLGDDLEFVGHGEAAVDGGAGAAQSWDGTWVGSNETWTVELIVADGEFQLDASCDDATPIRDTVSGRIDETGSISAYLETGYSWLKTSVTGTPEELDLRTKHNLCTSGPLKLERVAGEPAVAHATSDDGEAEVQTWDGTWAGRNSAWAVELTVADGRFRLDATCEGLRAIRDNVSGSVDETGQISAVLFESAVRVDKRPRAPLPIPVVGTPETLDFKGDYPDCRGGTLKLERVAGDPTVALATEQQAHRDPSDYNGRWKARSADWEAELTLDEGAFRLRAECGYINAETSGNMDDEGRINAVLQGGKWYTASVSGTIDRLHIVANDDNCRKATLKFKRAGSEPTVALAMEPPFNHFDGKWVGKGIVVQSSARCAATFAIEMEVTGRDFIAYENAGTGRTVSRIGQFNGTIDASGKIESKRISPIRNIYHGTLLADSGTGSGEWSSGGCNGTFELTRVEELPG